MDELIQVVHVRYHLSFPSKDVSLYSLFDSEHHNYKHTWFLPDLASKKSLIKRLMGWKSRKEEEEEREEGTEGKDTETSFSSCPSSSFSPIGLLPRPLLLRIFSFLPLLHNIGSVGCVCKKWKKIVETSDLLWWKLYKFDWNPDTKFSSSPSFLEDEEVKEEEGGRKEVSSTQSFQHPSVFVLRNLRSISPLPCIAQFQFCPSHSLSPSSSLYCTSCSSSPCSPATCPDSFSAPSSASASISSSSCFWREAYRWRLEWQLTWPFFSDLSEETTSLLSSSSSFHYPSYISLPSSCLQEIALDDTSSSLIHLLDLLDLLSVRIPKSLVPSQIRRRDRRMRRGRGEENRHLLEEDEAEAEEEAEEEEEEETRRLFSHTLLEDFSRVYPLVLDHSELLELLLLRAIGSVPAFLPSSPCCSSSSTSTFSSSSSSSPLLSSSSRLPPLLPPDFSSFGIFTHFWTIRHLEELKDQKQELCKPLLHFLQLLHYKHQISDHHTAERYLLIAVLKGEDPEVMEELSEIFEKSHPPPTLPLTPSLSLLDLKPKDIANELTSIQAELLWNIRNEELLFAEGPNCEAYFSFVQRLIVGIQLQLMHAKPSQRYTYGLHWFSVARLLHYTDGEDAVVNQEGALAVVCGLLSSVIFQRAPPSESSPLQSNSAASSSSCIPVQLLALESQLKSFKTTLEKATPGPGCIPLLTPFFASMKALYSSHNIIAPSPFPSSSSSSSSSSSPPPLLSFERVTRRRRGEALKNGAWLNPSHFFPISQEASLMMSFKDALIFSHTSSGRIRDFLLNLGEEEAGSTKEEAEEVAENEETEEEEESLNEESPTSC